jgi:hypothetical protein
MENGLNIQYKKQIEDLLNNHPEFEKDKYKFSPIDI